MRPFSVLALPMAALCAATASAQYATGFDTLNASAAGTILTGQDSFTLPASSNDFLVYTYTGNTPAFPANPSGGANFVAGSPTTTAIFARGERAIGFGCGAGRWTVGFDCAGAFTMTPPAADNLGSFSLQPSTTAKNFIALMRWMVPATPTNWKASFIYYDATTPNAPGVTVDIPGAGFQNLSLLRWYRWEVDINFTTNAIEEIRLKDIVANTTATHNPTGWYLLGGPASVAPNPTAFRMFGGGVPGNTAAFDNVSLQPAVARTRVVTGIGLNPPNSMRVMSGTARLGTTLTLGVDNPLGTQRVGSIPYLVLATGLFPIGIPIPGLSMRGPTQSGELHVDGITSIALRGPAWTGANNPAAFPIAIPNQCGLVGYKLYFQGIMIDLGGTIQAALADAVELEFGER